MDPKSCIGGPYGVGVCEEKRVLDNEHRSEKPLLRGFRRRGGLVGYCGKGKTVEHSRIKGGLESQKTNVWFK